MLSSVSKNFSSGGTIASPAIRAVSCVCLVLVVWACLGVSAHADVRDYAEKGKPDPAGLEILQQDAHDLILFTEESGGGWVKVYPLPFPGRQIPATRDGQLVIEVFGHEGKRYSVFWKDIEFLDLWEVRLVRETKQRIAKGDFVGAWPFLSILIRDYPNQPGLRQLRIDFLYKDASTRAQRGETANALAMLEELRRYAPEWERQKVLRALSVTSDRLMEEMLRGRKMEKAQQLLSRLEKDYQNSPLPAVKKWRDIFRRQAERKKASAETAFAAKDYRQARKLSREAIALEPTLPGGKSLVQQIDREYPLVNVGVLQAARVFDPIRIDNWSARRAGRLIYRTLFEIQGPGPAGGEYDFIFGDLDISADRQNLELILTPDELAPPLDRIQAVYLADIMANRARMSSETYFAPWASAVRGISIENPKLVTFELRRPNVLPTSLLQIPVDGGWFGDEPGSPTGDYRADVQNDQESRFVLRNKPRVESQPREIVERRLESASDGVSLLLQGEIDVCDQLFPADAVRLERAENIRVARYPLPTVHMLVPCSDHEYLNRATFRRALVYGTNREDILNGELLGGNPFDGCQVLSGPFPAGFGQDDPLGYAYDPSIAPRGYEPPLAKVLIALDKAQATEMAEKKKEDPPKLTPIRLGFPQDNLSRTACEAIKTQWELLDLEVNLVPLPLGTSFPKREDDLCDIVYVSAAVWEPVLDARRIIGPEGLAGSDNQMIGLGLRRLEEAINWKEVHQRLMDLHHIAHNELPILPLWQMVESYAYRKDLSGMGTDIVTLYQNADRWRIGR
ncbi:MAG: ABC transporter substrate-binding protein [Planctomycetota bacterium]